MPEQSTENLKRTSAAPNASESSQTGQYGGLPYIPVLTPMAKGLEQLSHAFGEFSANLFGDPSRHYPEYDRDGVYHKFDRMLNQAPQERMTETLRRMDATAGKLGSYLLAATVESAQRI